MSALISSIVAFIVASLAIFGLVPNQQMQPVPQMPQDKAVPIVQQAVTKATNVIAPPNLAGSDGTPGFARPTSGSAPLTVSFIGSIGGAQAPYKSEYTIQFGDGSSAIIPISGCDTPGSCSPSTAITHVYTKPGSYIAQLVQKIWLPSCATCADLQETTKTVAQVTIAVTATSASQPFVSVPGMSKYTDADFGFSFWYPTGWSVSTNTLNVESNGN